MNALNIATRGVLTSSSKCITTRGWFCYTLTDKFGVTSEYVSIRLIISKVCNFTLRL